MTNLQKIPMSEYLAHPAISRSDLLRIHEHNPYFYKWKKENASNDSTAATTYGSALHEAVFEPEIFDGKWGAYDGTRNQRHKAYQEWLLDTGLQHEHVLTVPEWDMLHATVKRVKSLPGPSYLLEAGKAEQTVIWEDPDTGLECKARFDFIDPERGLAVDLKSTADITPTAFAKSCANYGYAIQVVHYTDAMRALNGQEMVDWESDEEAPAFFFLAVSKDFPIEVALYQIDRADLQKAAAIRRAALRKIKECTDAKKWPGIPHEIQTLSLPKWWAPNVA